MERLPQLGGRFGAVDYRGFKLNIGAIAVEATVKQFLNKVGAGVEIRPGIMPIRYWINGRVYEAPPKGELLAIMSIVSENKQEPEIIMKAFRRALSWTEPSMKISLRDWLLQYTHNEQILGIFQALVTAMACVNATEMPAGEFFHFMREMGGFREYGYVPQGNNAVMDALAKLIRASGGEIWTRREAKHITVEEGKANGIIVSNTEDGTECQVLADIVISNIGPKATVEITGDRNFDTGYLTELREKSRPAPFNWIQLVSDEPFFDFTTLIVCNARIIDSIYCPTNVCPELAPPKKHLLVCGFVPVSSLLPINNERDIALAMQDLRDILPDFDKRAHVLMVNCYHGDWPGYRAWPGYDMPQKTPIENLYNVGDGAKPPGWFGIPACIQSARLVVDDIQKRFKPNSRRKP